MSASAHNKSSQTEELSVWEERETLTRFNHTLQSVIYDVLQEYEQRIARLNEEIGQLKEDLHKERVDSEEAKRQYKEIDAQNKRLRKFLKENCKLCKLYKDQGIQLISEQSHMERRSLDVKCKMRRWTCEAAKQTTQNSQDIIKEIQQIEIQLSIGVYTSFCSLC